MSRRLRQIWIPALLVTIAANAGYLVAFDDPTFTRVAMGLAHLMIGLLFCALLIALGLKERRKYANLGKMVAIGSVAALATGLFLVVFGTAGFSSMLRKAHVLGGAASVAITLAWIYRRARTDLHVGVAKATPVAIGLCILASAWFVLFRVPASHHIENPIIPAGNMADETFGGEDGMFFPSSAFTQDADTIPGSFFTNSEGCGRSGCHPDVTAQWAASAHRFSSFNNQWYRKSIEYMQEVKGLEAPKWCAGCHDHALLFSGNMARPVSEVLNTPEADAGIGCISCHSINSVKGTMGNGGLEIAYPLLHKVATSRNPLVQTAHDLALRVDPEPHRRAFLKPLHERQTAEFCSSCHKVHLDEPVNNYRWVRGFNTYDNWQASGVSGFGARSFYQPDTPMDCSTCHMPLVRSDDAGNNNGFVKSHAFLGANTALPTANQDSVHLQATIDFLKSDKLSVDIFAAVAGSSASGDADVSTATPIDVATTFAAGDEIGMDVGSGGVSVPLQPIVAPLRPGLTALRRGELVRLDVVVRSLAVGHFFPSGTVDAQEAWLELKVLDSDNNVIFSSGSVEDGGQGDVDPSAHFYRSRLVDANSNLINKRNAWAARSTVYVNLIPPGAADVARYRFRVPDAPGALRVVAALHYRKFDSWHNQFAYAGIVDPADTNTVTDDFDDRNWVFGEVPDNVSGTIKEVPVIPIVTMASDTLDLRVGRVLSSADAAAEPTDYLRWNDYGIGLLRQGDLRGSERAFSKAVELSPDYADGYVNLGRVFLREGDIDAARHAVDQALHIRPGFYKGRYLRGLIAKATGEYADAISELGGVARRFPRDRVVLGDLGRVYFLNNQLGLAVDAFESVLKIDPEDVGAHYNLMLIQRALGNTDRAVEHEIRYDRFKADEAAAAVARQYRYDHPHDNNEALPVHEHGNGSQ